MADHKGKEDIFVSPEVRFLRMKRPEMGLYLDMTDSKQDLIKYFQKGIKRNARKRLGVELEHFIVKKADRSTVSYFEDKGVEALLKSLRPFYDNAEYRAGHLLALQRAHIYISLEPAGQLEVSIGEFDRIEEFEKEYARFRKEADPILRKMGLELICLGYQPQSRAMDLPLIPKDRYQVMDAYFKQTGMRGAQMMRGTAATQVSIDYDSEQDFADQFRLANILVPLLAFITDNSPIFEGEKAEVMTRMSVWEDVDVARSGFCPGALDKKPFGFADYADYILARPPIFMTDASGVLTRTDLPASDVLQNQGAADENIAHVLSMFFPYVRLKTYLEMRVADSLPFEYVLGYLAFIKGIFYHSENLQLWLRHFAHVDSRAAQDAFEMLREKGLGAFVYGESVLVLVQRLFETAEQALAEEEKKYLERFVCLIDAAHQKRPLDLAKEAR